MRLRRWLALVATPVAALTIASGFSACATSGDPPAADTTFCSAASAWAAKCGTPSNACDAKFITDCSALENVMNASALAAAQKCLTSATECTATPSACLAGAAQGLTPTAAQTKVENDYCMTCQPEGESECQQAFFTANSPVASVSSALLELDDTVAGDVDKCTSVSGCASTFPMCAQTSLLNSLNNALDGDSTAVQCVVKAITTATTADAGTSDAGESDDATVGFGDDATMENDDSSTDGSTSGDGSTLTDGSTSGDGGTCVDDYEPNDTPDMATQLATVKDSDSPQDLHAAIATSGTNGDEDWYTFLGNDATNTTTSADPYASVTALTNIEVCVWAKETFGDAIASGCMSGSPTDYPISGTAFVGCCSSTGTAQMQNYGRTGPDDSSTVMMRVRMPAAGAMCVGYDLMYAFTK